LAFSIHAGLSILEKPEGCQTLQRVGLAVVQEWAKKREGFRFGGDRNQMPKYVDKFLRFVRGDFPRVIMGDVGGHSCPRKTFGINKMISTVFSKRLEQLVSARVT
jgi:hypothetical protein